MSKKLPVPLVVVLLIGTRAVSAQELDTLGSRAAGMSAFVAVADDASAVVWNPAGLLTGPLFNLAMDFGRSRIQPDFPPPFPEHGGRLSTTLIALGVPPLGLSYYRISAFAVGSANPAELGNLGRQEGQVVVRSLVTSHLGATVLQSLGDYVVVGATAKVVRGRAAAGITVAQTWDAGFDRAEMLVARGSTAGDVDAGVMVALGSVRAGLVVRNVLEPTFGDAESGEVEATLERHARVGLAWGDRWPGMSRTIIAIDADLTRIAQPTGDRRDVAAGIERWMWGQRVGLRGGGRISTIGNTRPTVTGGLSYAVRAGTYVDAYFAGGADENRGWGIGARLTY